MVPGPEWSGAQMVPWVHVGWGPNSPWAQMLPGPKWSWGPGQDGHHAQMVQGPNGPAPKESQAKMVQTQKVIGDGPSPSGPGTKWSQGPNEGLNFSQTTTPDTHRLGGAIKSAQFWGPNLGPWGPGGPLGGVPWWVPYWWDSWVPSRGSA